MLCLSCVRFNRSVSLPRCSAWYRGLRRTSRWPFEAEKSRSLCLPQLGQSRFLSDIFMSLERGDPFIMFWYSLSLALGGHSTPPPLSPHLLIIHAYYNYLGCFTCAAPDCSHRCYSTPRALSSGSTQEAEKSQSLGLPLLDPWYSFGGSRTATRASSGSFYRCRVSSSVSPKPARVLLSDCPARHLNGQFFRQKFISRH